MSFKETDMDVIWRAQRCEDKPQGLVTIGDSVFHVANAPNGRLQPHKITTIEEYDQHFGVPGFLTIQEALDNR